MTAPSSFSASAPIKSLGLRPGDTLIVYEVDNDVVTIALNRPATPCVSAQLARDFAQRWTGQFPVPVNEGDARLEHIVAKHVKQSMRVFLDTNVILDIPLGREGARSSQHMLELCGGLSFSLYASWHTLSTVSYILAKSRDDKTARAFISGLLNFVEIGPSSTALAQKALALCLKDLEDAMQIAVAEAVAADVIVTRNLADFSTSPVPAIDPEAFVERFAG